MKIPAVAKEIEQWKRRCLTPIGRSNIVKALMLSKLVHLFIALPNPSTRCIKEIERLIFEFVWGHKNDKIKRTKLVQDHSKDGLKMVHVESFIRSMKLSWFKRISFSMADWTRLAAQEIPNTWPLLSYGVKKLKLLRTKTTNLFYVDLLNALICFNQDYDPSEEDILTERLWCSDWTKYETTIARKWGDKGLRFVGDLFDKNTGKIYTKLDLTLACISKTYNYLQYTDVPVMKQLVIKQGKVIVQYYFKFGSAILTERQFCNQSPGNALGRGYGALEMCFNLLTR